MTRSGLFSLISGVLGSGLIGVACGRSEPEPAPKARAAAQPASESSAPEPAAPVEPPAGEPTPGPLSNAAPADACRETLKCAAACFAQAGAPAQQLAECADPRSPACDDALATAASPAPDVTIAGLRCALPCGAAHRTLRDLQGVDPTQWAALSEGERASFTGLIAGRDCVPGARCESICDGDYAPPATVARRAK